MAVLIQRPAVLFHLNALLPSEAVRWSKWRMAATALLPGSWLLFSLSYARRNFTYSAGPGNGWSLGRLPFLFCRFLWMGLLFVQRTRRSCPGRQLDYSRRLVWLLLLYKSFALFGTDPCQSRKTLTGFDMRRQAANQVFPSWVLVFSLSREFSHLLRSCSFETQRTDVFTLSSIILVVANILIIVSAIRNRLRDVEIYVSRDVFYKALSLSS